MLVCYVCYLHLSKPFDNVTGATMCHAKSYADGSGFLALNISIPLAETDIGFSAQKYKVYRRKSVRRRQSQRTIPPILPRRLDAQTELQTDTHMHTCMHACRHTHTYIHAYMQTYKHKHIHI